MRANLRRQPSSERAWQRGRRAGWRWAFWGAAVGSAAGVVLFAPASWLASALHRATHERVLLADATGSVWSGSAVAVLQGGPGSLDASSLPGRLHWSVAPIWAGLRLSLSQACCLSAPLHIDWRPGWQSTTWILPAQPQGIGQWPARWLVGLGTPWNTLQLGGRLRLSSPGLSVQVSSTGLRFDGALDIELVGTSSRVSPVVPLGHYRLHLQGDERAPSAAAPATSAPAGAALSLTTLDGALRLSGSGRWNAQGLRFRGEARAAEGQEAGLSNLLNIIGRRQGAQSVISIG